MNNKKGSLTLSLAQLLGIIIFFILFLGLSVFARNIISGLSESATNKQAFEELRKAVEEVADHDSTVAGKYYRFTLSQDAALIAMNPGSDFSYVYPDKYHYTPTQGRLPPGQDYVSNILGSTFERPFECRDNQACICLCEGIRFENPNFLREYRPSERRNIECDFMACQSSEKYFFVPRLYLRDVFDINDINANIPLNNSENYWDDSWIILRSAIVSENPGPITHRAVNTLDSNDETAVVPVERSPHEANVDFRRIVAGYRDHALTGTFDVFIYKAGYRQEKPVIGVCFKRNAEECLPIMGPQRN